MTNGTTLPGLTTGGTMNVYSAARDTIGFPVMAPHWMDLSLGYAYAIIVANQTGADITSGEINLQGADADPDNPCEPGPFRDLDPVADCGPLVTGIPWDPPVRIPITEEHPILAHSVCIFAVPCPLQFVQVTGVPAGTEAFGIVTRLRRTNFDHLGAMGGIPPPMQFAAPFAHGQAQLPPPQQHAQAQYAPQQQRQPQAQPQQPQQPQPQQQPPPQPQQQLRRERRPGQPPQRPAE